MVHSFLVLETIAILTYLITLSLHLDRDGEVVFLTNVLSKRALLSTDGNAMNLSSFSTSPSALTETLIPHSSISSSNLVTNKRISNWDITMNKSKHILSDFGTQATNRKY